MNTELEIPEEGGGYIFEVNPAFGFHQQNVDEILAPFQQIRYENHIADLETVILTLEIELKESEEKFKNFESHSDHIQTQLRKKNLELENQLEQMRRSITPTGLSSNNAEGGDDAEHDDYVHVEDNTTIDGAEDVINA